MKITKRKKKEKIINNDTIEKEFLIIKIVAIIIIILTYAAQLYIFNYSNVKELTIQVKEKYIKKYGESDTYMVIDSNNNSYKISDLIYIWKFNSTDLYTLLEIGEKYKITTSGIRCRIFSNYPNINKIEKISKER